ncbi:MAG: FHA domain-containing protein [Deltaproteobacteria bacterium]|nr:FHA domain-containing protein [Deltaproteobacteria bacterium]MCB9786073.1 FHA domain-containing protein [Deltaproteobacteria bacterium]
MFTLTIEDKHGGIADEYEFAEGEFLVGRSHSADIILPSDNVSRRHARLYTVDGRCYVEDLGSANGVFVNGRRIHEVCEIEGSAQVKVGDYYLHVKSDKMAEHEDKVHCRLHGQNLSVTDQVFRITRSVNLVGRGKDCTITVIDASVSRIHGKLTVERSGAITVEDLKSSNGTFVNGERVELATLNHKDLLRFGNVEFRVEMVDVAPGAGPVAAAMSAGTDEIDEPWRPGGAAPSRRGLWVALAVGAPLLIAGIVAIFVFGDRWFGGTPPETNATEEVEAADGGDGQASDAAAKADAGPTAAELAATKAEEVTMLLGEGRVQVEKRQWERALDTYQKVLERDTFNAEARQGKNNVELWQKDQATLDAARELIKQKKRAEAARGLRDIEEASVYYVEAKEELKRLLEMKPILVMEADALVKSRNCEEALAIYEEARQLDPRDGALATKIAEVKKLPSRKCK